MIKNKFYYIFRLWAEIIIYTQIYWWLRSPYTNYDYYIAWYVNSGGLLYDNGVGDYSYGRTISLGAIINIDAFITTTTRETLVNAGNTSIYTYFYGNILIPSYVNISSLCRIAGLREFVFQLFYFHKGA